MYDSSKLSPESSSILLIPSFSMGKGVPYNATTKVNIYRYICFSESLKENVTLRCDPLPPDLKLLSVKWFLDGALLKKLPECDGR